jgi:GNAT superfamily N-acetyltransferase
MLTIRPATIQDAPLLRTLICELAEFEHELDAVTIQEAELARDGFGSDPQFDALIAEWHGQPAGYALFFDSYSTWTGRQLFLEDLFVRTNYRGLGIGKSMLRTVAKTATERGCRALRWEVAGWNEAAIDLYRSIGVEFLDDWKLVLLRGEPLQRLAGNRK